MFVANEAAIDRVIRVVLGLVLLALVVTGPHTAWGWLGAIPLVTGLAGYCPLYRLVGAKAAGSSSRGCCS